MTKTLAAKPTTPFPSALPWPVSYWPTRKRGQSVVSKAEREGVVRLLEQYRGLEALAQEHDIAGISQRAADFERERRFPEALEARRRLERCDHALFVSTQEKMYSIRNVAADGCITILKRLYTSMDDELAEYALAREQSMERLGVPLYSEHRADKVEMVQVVTGAGHSLSHVVRDWRLIEDREAQAYWVSRNAVLHLLTMFTNGTGGWTAREVQQSRGIVTLQYLCTDAPCAGFSWV